jgi:cholesterol transport system auxiliary component
VEQGASASRRAQLGVACRLAVVFVLAATLSACALARLAVPASPAAIYDLTAPAEVPTPSGTRAQLLIPEPSALSALDTERIAIRPSPGQYAYLPQAVWSDSLPRLLQARLMETFQNTGRVRAAGLPGQGLLIHYQVILDIRAFEIRGGEAVAAFTVKLLDDRSGEVVGTRIVRASAPIRAEGTAAGVAALDAAMDAAFIETVGWVLTRV